MTDICLVNNIYYDSTRYNGSTTQVPASTDDNLLFPLLQKADDWSVAINKASIDLSTIPLTQNNIPLKTYQVGLQVGANIETAYVRQVGANQNNYVWNCPKTTTAITKYSYSSTGALTQISSQDVSTFMRYVHTFVVDDHQNLYIAGSDLSEEYADTLYIIDENNSLIQQNPYTFIKHLYLDRNQNLYVTDESATPSVYIYQTNASIGVVNLVLLKTLTTNHAGQPLSNILFAIADSTEIIVGYNTNMITLYNSVQYVPQTDITLSTYKQLAPTANIDSVAQSYMLSDRSELDDALFGTYAGNIYRLNDDQQITQWFMSGGGAIALSGAAFVDTGYLFAVGNDYHTYAIQYPQSVYPQELFSVNTSTNLHTGGIYSSQKNSSLYGFGSSYEYKIWNFNIGTGQPLPNTWTNVGEFSQLSSGIYPINIDVQSTTNKLLAVGSNNALYQSTNAVAPIEMLFMGSNSALVNEYGLNTADSSGNQDNYLITTLTGSAVNQGMFKSGTFYYVVENNTNLVQRKDSDYSIVATNNIGMSMNNITYLPKSSHFVFDSNGVCYAYNLLTMTMTSFYIFANISYGGYAELDTDYFCTFSTNEQGNYIYVFQISTKALVCTQSFSNYIIDIASNTSDTSYNGATSLFAVMSTSSNPTIGNIVNQITFTNNTYTAVDTYQPTLYSQAGISSIFCHTNSGRLMFFVNTDSTHATLNTLFQSCQYSSQYMNAAKFKNHQFIKEYVYLNQTTSQTKIWTPVNTNGMQLTSVSVSRSNPNRLYAVNLADKQIYMGTLLNNSVSFSIVPLTGSAKNFDYISNMKNDDPLVLTSTLHLYNLQNQSLIASTVVNGNVPSIARNDVANQYVVSASTQGNLIAFNPTTLAIEFTQALNGVYNIMAKNGDDIDIGPVSIYNMSVFVDAVNAALATACNRLNGVAPGSLSEPPTITLNYQTGLCTLNYVSTLAQPYNAITFNDSLLNLIYFYNIENKIMLNPNAPSITQTSKTLYNFNQLDKILFQSNTIYVTGSFYGINSSNRIITDIDVPTGDFIDNIGQKLLYQPNFLRPYFLQSNLPLQRIQLDILYTYRDGSQYSLMINQGQNFTTKLQFIRKF